MVTVSPFWTARDAAQRAGLSAASDDVTIGSAAKQDWPWREEWAEQWADALDYKILPMHARHNLLLHGVLDLRRSQEATS